MIDQLLRWYGALTKRERLMVHAAVLVVGVGLLWGMLFDPAWQGRKRLAQELPKLRADAAQIDALAGEVQRFSNSSGVRLTGAKLREELDKSIREAGLAASSAEATDQADRIELRFSDVPYPALLAWIDGAQRALRVRASQLLIQRAGAGNNASGHHVNAQVSLDATKSGAQ